MKIDQIISESVGVCSECGGPSFTDLILAEKKDACYHKVKASAKVWPSAYASGRLVQCRKKGAANYGNKSEGVAEGSLSEIDRRGFLKGMGAAAVAGAAGGAKAQEVKFDVAARIAVQKAQTAIGKFFTVKFGGEQSRIMDYIAQNVNKAVLAYCMDTNGYNVLEVIDYATDSAYRAADAVPPSITDRGGAKTAISTANTFMDAYTAAILQKLNEYTKAGRSRQQSQPQQQAQQQRSGAKDIFTPEYANLNLALALYIISKDSNPEIHTQVKDTLNQYIQNNNNKEFVNDAYRAIVSTIESARKRDPEVQTRREDSFIKAHKSIIDNLNKSAPKDEFKESVEQGMAEGELDEGWKETLGAATLAGAMALGSAGAQARVTPDGQGGFTGGMKPAATVTAPVPARIDSPSGPSGFSKEYLQKAADPNRTGRYMISIEKAQELLKQTNEGTAGLPDPNNFDSDWEYQDALDAYGKTQDNDSDFENMTDEPDDWFDESKEKIGNMDADDFDAAMARLKKLAGAGPMKTVYDPDRRVYRNMPTAQQPPKQLKK